MKHSTKIVACIIILISFLIGACELGVTPIGKIVQNPRQYADTAVTVSGDVTEIFSLFVIKYFVVNDKTGQIVVVTDKPLPKKGTAVKVSGTVREAFSIGDQQLLVLIEKTEK